MRYTFPTTTTTAAAAAAGGDKRRTRKSESCRQHPTIMRYVHVSMARHGCGCGGGGAGICY